MTSEKQKAAARYAGIYAAGIGNDKSITITALIALLKAAFLAGRR